MKNIFINKKVWSSFNDDELEDYVSKVFEYYRHHGFPYFSTDKSFRDNEFRKLINYNGSLLEDKVIRQTMHGLSLAWSYMPHSWDIQCGNMLTPKDVFNDDDLFKRCIAKRIKMGDNMSDNGIRKMMKMFTGTQSVSNFRPTAASALYSHFLPNGGNILDMSCGFGGRLLGFIKTNHSNNNYSYVGYDPSTSTYNGLCELKNDYGRDMDITINHCGSELMTLTDECDFAFTSPPYFDTEKYSTEPTQSYIKYPTTELWLNGFMYETISNTYRALKNNSYMALNIANVKSYPNMCGDIVELCERIGFVLEDEYGLALSNSNFKSKKSAYKYEPVYIFKKQH